MRAGRGDLAQVALHRRQRADTFEGGAGQERSALFVEVRDAEGLREVAVVVTEGIGAGVGGISGVGQVCAAAVVAG